MFPLSAWLPDSYPTAPAPVTAVFAGLLTKVGVYAIIRTQTLLFPGGALDDVLMWAALATMLVGILGAVAQTDIRRILSFTLVSHIGYMVFGIALATAAGLAGAIFYVVHHIAIQTTLFLVAGLVERRGGSTLSTGSAGWRRRSPLLAVLFFVPAMNLAGIPPFSGFLGKLGLLQAGVADGGWLACVAGRRRRRHQPADPGGHRRRLEPGLLAAAGAGPGRGPGAAAAAPTPEPSSRRRRRRRRRRGTRRGRRRSGTATARAARQAAWARHTAVATADPPATDGRR